MEAFAAAAQLTVEGIARPSGERMAEEVTSDEQLLKRIRKGDEAAFAFVYERHQSQIYRFVLHMTGSSATAEEVTQESFMLLIRKSKAYDPAKGTLSAYLFGVARNLARRTLRQELRDVALDDAEEDYFAHGGELDLLDKLSHSEMLEWMRTALLGLPQLYREVVVLCDLEEMSYARAADILECSPGTIASRLHRAHAMLKTRLNRVAGTPCLPMGKSHV